MDFEDILIDFMARLLVLPLYPLLADAVDSERSEKPKRTPSEGQGVIKFHRCGIESASPALVPCQRGEA